MAGELALRPPPGGRSPTADAYSLGTTCVTDPIRLRPVLTDEARSAASCSRE